ncbi:MAG: hypothetical protein MSJ26_10590 [Oscillospiraceae bacterium]|nr:hypothetical protein [Oscillospiraceae bacterium]
MGIHLKIGDIDVSRFITTNKYSAETAPVFDDESAFVNIYGEKIRNRTGHEVTVRAVLSDVDDITAAGLSAEFDNGSMKVTYSAPEEKSADFDGVKLSLSLDRVFGGERFWTADIVLHAAFVPEDCL